MVINKQKIMLGEIPVEVIQKDIKNVHLSVYPPEGSVRISAPLRMDLETIRIFAISKLGWIKQQQAKLRSQQREAPREYITRESHYYLGKRYLLKIVEHESAPVVEIKHDTIELRIRKGTSPQKRQQIFDEWYRQRLREIVPGIIERYEKLMQVKADAFTIRKMKTKWGTCNTITKRILLNLELAKKPLECIEYIIVHELVHLLQRHHNNLFISLMDKFMPQWRHFKEELNRLPISHAEWKY